MNGSELRELIDSPSLRSTIPAVEVTRAFLERISAEQARLNAFFTVTADLAIADAERADAARSIGKRLPLDGMPIAVKDNIDVGGVRTTVGSKFFEDHVAEQDAEVVRRLRAAGAVIVGKSALHEFVYGVTCNNPFYGPSRNPWNVERIPGGSSGGSGAALAADLCIGALGSDTGGSVRIPAALDGVTGLRTTYGSVSNRGVFPVSWTYDTVGPMARGIEDVAALFGVMAAYDPADPRAVEPPAAIHREIKEQGLTGLRIGLPTEYFWDGVEPEIETRVRDAAKVFEGRGAELVEIGTPGAAEANEICTLIIRADALGLHQTRYREHPELFGEDILRRLKLGEAISGAAYAAMVQRMLEWRVEARSWFQSVDLILSPTTNAVAPPTEGSEMIATTAQMTHFTYPWSLAHLPAISLPCGSARDGLPAGVQLAAAPYGEDLLIEAGRVYQQVTDWHTQRPPSAIADGSN